MVKVTTGGRKTSESSETDCELSKLLPENNVKYRSTSSLRGGSVISFHNICYMVQVKEGRKKIDKVILNNVSGIFKPGLNAILGPTGSGKTTLLDILASRKEPQRLQGTILIDGVPPHPNFRLISGYVLQDDVVMGTLTVRENLTFCAALRLPGYYTKQQRRRRVADIIAQLGLEECADTKVGTNVVRGISGGERKRTCIGMELMIRPTILFLDEPTTGLDASTAMSVMHILARLSQHGHTIVFSIHQPRYGIFRLFTKMHMLDKGETVFHGPAEECLNYFNSLGYKCDKYDNPADFFLDVIRNEDCLSSPLIRDEHENHTSVSACYRSSKFHKQLEDEADAIHDKYSVSSRDSVEVKDVGYPTSWFVQFSWLCMRNASNLYRNPRIIRSQYLISLFIALLIGAIFFQLKTTATSGIQDRIGAIFLIVAVNMKLADAAIAVFLEEKPLVKHETASGYYCISSYFLAKLVASEIPQRLIPFTCISPIIYFMIGLRPGFIPFLEFTLNMLILIYAYCSITLFIGINVRTITHGNMISWMIFVLQIMFAGFLININSIPKWLQFLEYASIARYAINAASIIEFRDRSFCDPYPYNSTCSSGNQYLEDKGIEYSWWSFWSTQIAMAMICCIFWMLSYLALRRMPKHK